MEDLRIQLQRNFWTSEDEMIEEIEEETDYDVLNVTEFEMDVIDRTLSDDEVKTYVLVRANNTIAIRD